MPIQIIPASSLVNPITALTTDVVAQGPGIAVATIQPNVVDNTKLAQMPTLTLKGNKEGNIGNPEDLTVAQVTAMGIGGGGPTQQAAATPWFGTPTISRALSSVYQNLTGKVIYAAVCIALASGTVIINAYVDANSLPITNVAMFDTISGNYHETLTFIILPNYYYRVVPSGGSPVIYSWVEWN